MRSGGVGGPSSHGLFRNVDSVQVPVPDLDQGLAFYRDRLGHELIWRTEAAAGLRRKSSRWGGTVLGEPADIPVGRAAVVADPVGTPLTIVDLSKGCYLTDAEGNVTAVA